MRKITLGRFPEAPLEIARQKGAAALARLWGGEDVKPPRKRMSSLFRDFATRYRERRQHRWKPSSLETYDIYLRSRLIPHFGKLRLNAIDYARVSAWFDAASEDKPGAANWAFDILRAMLASAHEWGDIAEHVPDACVNIVKNPRKSVGRHLDRAGLERLGAVLDRREEETPWPVAAIRLLTLTGARLSEIVNLRWEEIGDPGSDGASARIEDSKTGPRTICARAGSGRHSRGASPARGRGAGVSGEPYVKQPVYVLGRYPERGRSSRCSHSRLSAHLGLAGRDERSGDDDRRSDAWTPEAREYGDLCPSR